jgi:predicted DNA-binding protein
MLCEVMTFSIHIDEPTAEALARAARAAGRTRNALIRQAIQEWLTRRERQDWPAIVREFKGDRRVTPFETSRRALREPPADPLASTARSRRRP